MAKITLLLGDTKQREYPNVNDFHISAAGILSFHWKTQQGRANELAHKYTTSVPFIVEEDIQISS